MAEKRMFAKQIIDSDAFLDMPLSTQALYFHLSMRADDDGFVDNPKKIQRTIGASIDDLKLLLAKRYILAFESGVIVIKHWRIHNTIRSDRYKETVYVEEKSQLIKKDNGAYTEKDRVYGALDDTVDSLATNGKPNGNQMETQYSIDKIRLDKDSINIKKGDKRETSLQLYERLRNNYTISDYLDNKLKDWFKYKTERKEPYKEMGMGSLLKKIISATQSYGEVAMCEVIDLTMANQYKGIVWDWLKKYEGVTNAESPRGTNREDKDNYATELDRRLAELNRGN